MDRVEQVIVKFGKGEVRLSEALTRLEAIVARMDDDSLDVEDALRMYEEGCALVQCAQTTLRRVRERATVLGAELGDG